MQPLTSIDIPGSKSASHRALICAALVEGESNLHNLLESADINRTLAILEQLGARFNKTIDAGSPKTFSMQVHGIGSAPDIRTSHPDSPMGCDMGESGTSCRLLTAILAAGKGQFKIFGSGRMHQRPVMDLVSALNCLGAQIEYLETAGFPPILLRANTLSAKNMPGEQIGISLDESSQFMSGLLLAAPLNGGMTILIEGESPISWPYVRLTLSLMQHFGINVTAEELSQKGTWHPVKWQDITNPHGGRCRLCVPAGKYKASELRIESDWSSASYFLAAGAIGETPVRVNNMNPDSQQGDTAILDILQQMGAAIHWEGNTVTVSPQHLRGLDLDMGNCPDLVPTILAVAAHAEGATIIRNVAHLRLKESDRLQALATELGKSGCIVMPMPDGLVLAPPPAGLNYNTLANTEFNTHNDHRIAMALTLLGQPKANIKLDNKNCVDKSFPDFWNQWAKIKVEK